MTDETKKKRILRPSPAQMRAAAKELETDLELEGVDDLRREALADTAAWLRHEAEKSS